MNLEIWRLLFDFGMVVLIWLVQLVIYPGLCYYNSSDVAIWHQKYTPRVSYVVMPLMVGQLLLAIIQVTKNADLYTVFSLCAVLILWLSTFIQFVPLHSKISGKQDCTGIPQKLVKRNWFRTVLWTLVFLWSVYWVLMK
ncbi:hypothetical protein [Leeuwenhoekiella nanhaiensis]|uniref:DUF1772 domain-containing protein n=1 Tax=Leeuwenhoekiella nanhaiensis TaxID=1655491 RepID=A0A2G1VRB7_9FLAO|nr:hypothetical protein [Leeuwenhoekiella nanhaiensis]PHQ29318.1 hypothetical protein CJ305_10245 [Leeuwenhoekiella nanhaiensis]